jgi:hypothetical protein
MNVLQDWVAALPLCQQGVLIAAVRGPDTIRSEDRCKKLIRAYRGAILNFAHMAPNTFVGDGTGVESYGAVVEFYEDLNTYPLHWFQHFLEGAEVIAYTGPNEYVRKFWNHVYFWGCKTLHMTPESKEAFGLRLKDTNLFYLELERMVGE